VTELQNKLSVLAVFMGKNIEQYGEHL